MYNTKDNIVALATTPSKSALSVVRCSGSGALDLYKKLTKENDMKTLIGNAADVDALAALYVYNDDNPRTRPLGEWPDPVS